MTFKPSWYDPPEGWRFGFPKAWPKGLATTTENLAAQLQADGYPNHAIPVAINYTRFGGFEQMTYEQWMEAVDKLIQQRTGNGQEDLPDWLSRDAYERGMTPEEGSEECLQSVGWYEDDSTEDEL